MAVERRDPLPIGRYWVFVFERDRDAWARWTAQFSPRWVRVRATSQLDHAGLGANALEQLKALTGVDLTSGERPADFVQFDVLEPVPWLGIGFPNIVPKGLPSPIGPTDVIDAPEPGDLDSQIPFGWIAAGALGILALVLLRRQ